jgi:hypothetical protein
MERKKVSHFCSGAKENFHILVKNPLKSIENVENLWGCAEC